MVRIYHPLSLKVITISTLKHLLVYLLILVRCDFLFQNLKLNVDYALNYGCEPSEVFWGGILAPVYTVTTYTISLPNNK